MTDHSETLTDHTMLLRGDDARVVQLNRGAVDALKQQRRNFVEKFGREPGPNDPVFFDPDEDEPVQMSEERLGEWLSEEAERAGLDVGDDPEAFVDRLAADRRAIQEEHGHSRKIARNDPCPCGSGRKFKRCHGA